MPFTIDTFSPKVFNQFTNGQNLDQNLTFFDSTFTGNVEKVRIEVEFEFTWFAEAISENWTLSAGGLNSNFTDFRNEGFAVGQKVEFYQIFGDRYSVAANFTFEIAAFLNNGKNIIFTNVVGTIPTGIITGCGIWADASEALNRQSAIIVNFGLPQNNSNDSFSSLLDNSVQRYETSSVNNTGVTVLAWASSTKSAQTGSMEVERITQVNKNTVRYVLRHDLVINPYWLDTDDQVILNPPNNDFKQVISSLIDRFTGNNCLRYINEIEVRQAYTNPQNRKAKITLVGNTGWFYDNFNSGSFKFEQATDIIYNSGATTGLVFGQANTIEFTIKAINNQSIGANSRFGVYTSILPPPNRYQSQLTDFISNFAYDCAVNSEGAAASVGENGIITDCEGSLISVSGVNRLLVNATIDFTGTNAMFNDNFVIWTGIETPAPVADIPILPCNTTVGSISTGTVREWKIILFSGGGVINLDFDSQLEADKLEIIHNGIKVATTGMTVANSGPFDLDNGTANHPAADQYINTTKGVIPNRSADFLAENGFAQAVTFQQLVWFNYDATDYAASDFVIVRVTKVGENYRLIQHCPT